MKRRICAGILGIAACSALTQVSRGAGYIYFENYGNTTYGQVTYALSNVPAGKAGLGVEGYFTANLLYGLGTITNPAGLTSVPPQTASGQQGEYPFPVSCPTPFYPEIGWPGVFLGPLLQIPDYTSGPITFEVVAYNGSTYDDSTIRGASALFTLAFIATDPSQAGEFGTPGFLGYNGTTGLEPFTVQLVPEPSALDMAGLSALLLAYSGRRIVKISCSSFSER
jgi:hypothetical protein